MTDNQISPKMDCHGPAPVVKLVADHPTDTDDPNPNRLAQLSEAAEAVERMHSEKDGGQDFRHNLTHPARPTHPTHPTHPPHPTHRAHLTHPTHPAHATHPTYPAHLAQPAHRTHPTHPAHPTHPTNTLL